MSLISAFLPASVIPEAQGLARIVFGLLLVRHGLEQVFGYPPALVDYPPFSLRGALKIICLPGGILVMLGLFTRPVSFTIALLYLGYWLVEPLPASLLSGQTLFGARGPSDPILLTGFFLMFLAASGPGAWNLDRLRHRSRVSQPDPKWAEYSLGALRIVAAFLFIHHGLGKVLGPNPADPLSLRGLAAVLELAGGPMLMAVAYFLSHAPNGFWGSFAGPNQQAAVLNCFLFLLFWAAGPGAWSLDGVRRRRSAATVEVLGAARGTQ